MKGKFRSRTAHLTAAALLISLIPAVLIVSPSSATVSTTVASVYVDAPFVQGSYARHHGGVTENFNGLSNGSISSNTHSIVGGTKTSGQFTVFANSSTFGATTTNETATVGGSGTKFANTDSSGFEITFTTPVKYIGFYWAAGNATNNVKFFSGSTEIASFSTANLQTLLGSFPGTAQYAAATDSITATNGATYQKKYYFGPAAGYSTETPTAQSTVDIVNEPYAYVHTFAREDESFDRLQIYGAGFEFDNLTVSTQEVPIRNSLVLVNDVTTTLTLGESKWNFKGVTTTDSSTISTGWVSDSSTVVSSKQISIEQDLSISSGTITMGRTALFRTAITNTASNTCGNTFTLVDSYTATDTGYRNILLADNGTPDRNRLIRGFCYKWTLDPSSSLGSGAIRPTSSATGTRFNSNLDSPIIIIPEAAVESCEGAGAIQNGSFEEFTDATQFVKGGAYNRAQNESTRIPTGWKTTAKASNGGKAVIETWYQQPTDSSLVNISGPSSGSAFDGGVIAEIAADSAGDESPNKQGLYQDVATLSGSRVFWSYRHHFRNSSNSAAQIARFRAASTPNSIPSGNIWTGAEQASPFGSNSVLTDTTHSVSSTDSWTLSSGTFVADSSLTRFLFQNDVSPDGGFGNLIDDVKFTTYSACPIRVKIVAGRTSNFVIRNVEQDTSRPQVYGNTFRYYAPAAAEISALSGIPTGLTASVSNIANTSSTFSLSSVQVGTYTFSYRVSYEFAGQSYSTTSTMTVEVVPEVTARFPSEVPFDPTLTVKSLPGIRFNSATNAYVCFDQVANRSGGSISPTTVSVGQSGVTSGAFLVSSGPPLIDSGTVGALTNQSRLVRITSNSGVLGRGGSKFLRVRASSIDNTDGVAPSCANGISFVIEFKTIKMTQTRRYVVPLKNGRQQN